MLLDKRYSTVHNMFGLGAGQNCRNPSYQSIVMVTLPHSFPNSNLILGFGIGLVMSPFLEEWKNNPFGRNEESVLEEVVGLLTLDML